MSNTQIGRCEVCNQDYCQNCTDNAVEEWQRFCSVRCEKEFYEELDNE